MGPGAAAAAAAARALATPGLTAQPAWHTIERSLSIRGTGITSGRIIESGTLVPYDITYDLSSSFTVYDIIYNTPF